MIDYMIFLPVAVVLYFVFKKKVSDKVNNWTEQNKINKEVR